MSEDREPTAVGSWHPAVDVRTDTAAVLLQQRPVVPLTRWIADAAQLCVQESLLLQVVTPQSSRLTVPLEDLLRSSDACWVVRTDGGSYYDGLRGSALEWDGRSFSAAGGAPAPEFVRAGPTDAGSIELDLTVLHPAREQTTVGEVAGACLQELTGESPHGWGVAEPATERWDVGGLTRLARARAPRSTRLVVVGGAPQRIAVGTLTVRRLPTGVHERLRLSLGSTGAPNTAGIDSLAERLAERHAVRVMTAGLRPGRADGTVEPYFRGQVLPYGVLFGGEAVSEQGTRHALSMPAPHVLLVGPPARPGCWARLVGGAGPQAEPTQAEPREPVRQLDEPAVVLGRVMAHMLPAHASGGCPGAGA